MPKNSDQRYYDSAALQWPIFDELKEAFRYRDLLRLLVANSLKTRYKRSVLGVFWTLLNPLLTMSVLAIAFSALFRFSLNHYPVYLLTGLVFWNFFSSATLGGMKAILVGGALLRRIYLPRTIFSISAVGSELLNLGLAMIPLALLMTLFGQPVTPAILFLPIAVLVLTLFTLGITLLISTIAVFFNDWMPIYQVLVMAWFYLTPIIYPREIVPPKFSWITQMNPMGYLLDLFRDPIYFGRVPQTSTILISVGVSLLSLLIGWWTFTRKAKDLAYLV